MITSDDISKVVSFQTHADNIIGVSFDRVKVLGILDVQSASMYNDVQALALSVYPSLPQDTPKDYRQYTYVKVKLTNGDSYCVANEWINQETKVVHEDVQATFSVSQINVEDIERIRNLLAAHNYNNVTVIKN